MANVIDGFIGYNESAYFLTKDGDMYFANTDGTYEICEGVENVDAIIHTTDKWYCHVVSSNSSYYVHVNDSNNKQFTQNHYDYTNYLNNKLLTVYETSYFAYVNSENKLVWRSYFDHNWEHKVIGDATNIKDIIVVSNNLYYLTNNGLVYAVGSASNNALTSLYGDDSYTPVKIYFGEVSTEQPLTLVENNISVIKEFTTGKVIEFTYNQKLFANNLNRISLQDSKGNQVAINVKLINNKVVITLLEDLTPEENYTFTFNNKAFRTFFNQYNQIENYTFTYLTPKEVTDLTVNVEDVTIGINEYIKLDVTTTPDQVDNRYLTYRSSDYAVASVDENGYIYANKSGNAVITVSYINEEKGINITKEVKVKVITKVTSVEVEELVIVKQNETHKLEVTFEPFDAVDAIFTYESSDESVATINEFGVVTALNAGSTVITIKCGSFIKYSYIS